MIDQVFKASIDSILIADTKGIITEVNPAAEGMLGYKKNELAGKHVSQLYASKEDHKKVLAEIQSTGKFNGEIINKTKSGRNINVFLSANPILDKDNNITGMMGISRDITSSVALQKKYEDLTNSVVDIVYSTDVKGNFTYINESIKKILGYEAKELVGTLFVDIIYKPHLKYVNKNYDSQIKKKLDQSYLEFQVIKKNGDLLWIGQYFSIKFDLVDKDKIDGFYGLIREIDKQKKTEISLSKSKESYKELFDNSSDLIQSIDIEGNFLYVNNSWKQIMGYSNDEIAQLNLFSLIHPDSIENYTTLFNTIIQTGVSNEKRFLYGLVAKNGQKIMVEGSLNTKIEYNKIVSIQSFLSNITKQKEIEKQLTEKEMALRQITETLSDVFYLYNIVEKKYDYISSNCEVVLGANQEFFYSGKSHTKTYSHPEDSAKLIEANKTIDSGESYSIDYRVIIDNETRWVNEKSFPIRNDKGEVISNSGICRDITNLKIANETIYKQNIEIGASMIYAKRLLDSVLPNKKKLMDLFPDSFILYKPKNIVSGDFYVVDYIKMDSAPKMPTFIVGDCTGHGIPGAVLSLMCNVLVKESFTRHDVDSPSEALDFVRNRLVKFFKSDDGKIIRDGMDIAFCVLNKPKNQLYFSGANISCIIIRNKKIIEYKGDRQHVGYSDNPRPFKNHIIDVETGDLVFLYTDGYTDQFGGENNKKHKRTKLYELLLDAISLPMQEVGMLLESNFLEWKKDEEQVDDVTVLGIRIE